MERSKEYLRKIYNINQWQTTHNQQLNYVRNLFIVLSAASIGFIVNLLFSDIRDPQWIELAKFLAAIISLFGFSILTGIISAILEEKNHRLKIEIAKIIERENFEEGAIVKYERRCKLIEDLNHGGILLLLQLLSYFVGLAFLALVFYAVLQALGGI